MSPFTNIVKHLHSQILYVGELDKSPGIQLFSPRYIHFNVTFWDCFESQNGDLDVVWMATFKRYYSN